MVIIKYNILLKLSHPRKRNVVAVSGRSYALSGTIPAISEHAGAHFAPFLNYMLRCQGFSGRYRRKCMVLQWIIDGTSQIEEPTQEDATGEEEAKGMNDLSPALTRCELR